MWVVDVVGVEHGAPADADADAAVATTGNQGCRRSEME
jgi:hypothetical protein